MACERSSSRGRAKDLFLGNTVLCRIFPAITVRRVGEDFHLDPGEPGEGFLASLPPASPSHPVTQGNGLPTPGAARRSAATKPVVVSPPPHSTSGPTGPPAPNTLGSVQYQKKPHSHIVPAGYLRAWADGKQIAMRRVGVAAPVVIGVRDAAVHKDFYRRERPTTGEAIYDVEWSLEQGEQAAIPVLRDIVNRWPLQSEEKAKIGQFLAMQHLRGPAFKRWHEGYVAQLAAELRTDPKKWGTPPEGMTHEEAVERYIEQKLMSDTERLTQMRRVSDLSAP